MAKKKPHGVNRTLKCQQQTLLSAICLPIIRFQFTRNILEKDNLEVAAEGG